MNLYIQDPTYPDSYSLHEALLQACEGAHCGGGAYAFVSSGGVKLFLEDDAFIRFISNGRFKLIVGIDEITNEHALTKLKDLRRIHADKLEVFAFLHDTKGSLFHPKFSWFKNVSGGVLVIGSGNLTEKGLRRNREAFNVTEVEESKITEIEAQWNNWLYHNVTCLKTIDDEDVIEKVKENALIYSKVKRKAKLEVEGKIQEEEKERPQAETIFEDEDLEAWKFVDIDSVLISEIPRGKNRWNQANFDKDSFIHFFGAKPGNNSLRILLKNVLHDGSLSDTEVRPSVSVKSHNWRFELKAAAGKEYPTNGRPIGIFIRVSTRMFLYVLAMPTDNFYDEVRKFLFDNYTGRSDRLKRFHATVLDLKYYCEHLPFWNIMT